MRILSVREPKLRGRKYYWHSQVDLEQYRGNQLSAMKQRIRPMKAVGRDEEPLFRFRVYFERLNRTQLNQLKWAIDFGNPACAHKIGTGFKRVSSGRRIRPDHLNVLSGNILEPVHNLKCLIKSHQRYLAGRETGGLYRVVNFFIEIRDVNDGNGYIFL